MADEADYTEALNTVNDIHDGMSSLARSVVSALKDGKVSPMEGMQLGIKGMSFATTVIALMQDGDAAARNKILYILEHGRFTLDET